MTDHSEYGELMGTVSLLSLFSALGARTSYLADRGLAIRR
jgi:hypothetical protein